MRFFTVALTVCLAATVRAQVIGTTAVCPDLTVGTPVNGTAVVPNTDTYAAAVATLNITEVILSIIGVLTDSQECWPADSFPQSAIGTSYGGLFIRLAWHCAGTFRRTDELGGCTGGRQRFPPESAWPDNTNLDKARALLVPIKQQYGDALSWGDLMVLAGTASILHMGGPVTEICVGREDEPDGSASVPLGPDPSNFTRLGSILGDDRQCNNMQGNCSEPFGASSVGLIYVNPEGFMGEPNQLPSAQQIRRIFGRMDMNDSETVALIGGGHAFGRSHGRCDASLGGAGPGPIEQPLDPWPGTCTNDSAFARGRGANTFTSGIEGYWTNDPLKWDNEFFQLLRDYGDNYTLETGEGGAHQWSAPGQPDFLMMMTTDLALWADPIYREISRQFADDIEALNVAFANAWFKLVDRGSGFPTAATRRCMTPDQQQLQQFLAPQLRQEPITPEPTVPTDPIEPTEPTVTVTEPVVTDAPITEPAEGACPYILEGTPPNRTAEAPSLAAYGVALQTLNVTEVLLDIVALLTDSQECWPADSFPTSAIGQSYGGLFIRLAWHCAGTFRKSDGVGGCAGGNQRFPPESAWPDNTNLDKARALLVPIKRKYDIALSWGDLMVLAGTASILHMGGPVTEVCVGRIDNPDGTTSLPLGPDPSNFTRLGTILGDDRQCGGNQSDCSEPFGASSVGLIYVNPEGFQGKPEQLPSAQQIRKIFGRMDMNDSETVALIGGGHAFGRSHGACDGVAKGGAGPGPILQPDNPWPGTCDNDTRSPLGRGFNTFTSGIEGYWTNDPLKWDNEFFQLLAQLGDNYTLETGEGGAHQWSAPGQPPDLMMMTTDLALWADPVYREISRRFAEDIEALNVAFANAWFKLVDRGGGYSHSRRCMVPDAQLFLAPELRDQLPPSGTDTMTPNQTESSGNTESGASRGAVQSVTLALLCLVAYSFSL